MRYPTCPIETPIITKRMLVETIQLVFVYQALSRDIENSRIFSACRTAV